MDLFVEHIDVTPVETFVLLDISRVKVCMV